MTTSDGYVVEPLNLDRFGDLEEILGHGGIGGCWCMYWTIPTTALWRDGARGGSNAANRESLLAMLEADSSPGLRSVCQHDEVVAVDDDQTGLRSVSGDCPSQLACRQACNALADERSIWAMDLYGGAGIEISVYPANAYGEKRTTVVEERHSGTVIDRDCPFGRLSECDPQFPGGNPFLPRLDPGADIFAGDRPPKRVGHVR
jgi:hypothetical protein